MIRTKNFSKIRQKKSCPSRAVGDQTLLGWGISKFLTTIMKASQNSSKWSHFSTDHLKDIDLSIRPLLSNLLKITAEDVWFFCDLSLKFIPPINIWKIYIDLRLFSKFWVEPFMRPLRSKEVRCWILRLRPQNFCNHFWKFGCQPPKSKADLCMTNGYKVLIYLSFLLFLKDLLL